MKLRRLPSDFVVQEINSLPISRSGDYSVYELTKTGWNTMDAKKQVAQAWKIPTKNIAHAGLKDRHAVTRQVLTVRKGPQRSWRQTDLELEYLGAAERPVQASDIQANHFEITVRSISQQQASSVLAAVPIVKQNGIVNYFDDQRFGSHRPGSPFIAEPWIRADYESALRLTFATPTPHDSTVDLQQQQILIDHWGDWKRCKELLDRSHRRSIITFLDDRPGDFKGAWARVDTELRGLFLSAFQSYLWNAIVSDLITDCSADGELATLQLSVMNVAIPASPVDLASNPNFFVEIPLPSARLKLDDELLNARLEKSLGQLGWSLSQLKVKYPRDRFFSRSWRRTVLRVDDLDASIADDELDPGQSKLSLSFTLPSGAYATMVIKHLMLETSSPGLNDVQSIDSESQESQQFKGSSLRKSQFDNH